MSDALIHQAVSCLQAGKVIAYPTEAVWGLGCDPHNEVAVKALLRLKQRPMEKGLILIAANINQFTPYLTLLDDSQRQQLQESWPGFQTWVVPVSDTVPIWLKGNHQSIALRVSDHPLVQALCVAFGGPLVSTSANPTGAPPAREIQQVEAYFTNDLDFILSGERGDALNASPIIDIVSGKSIR